MITIIFFFIRHITGLSPQKTIKKYVDLYNSEDFPSRVKDVGYEQRIKKAYPFHPELLNSHNMLAD